MGAERAKDKYSCRVSLKVFIQVSLQKMCCDPGPTTCQANKFITALRNLFVLRLPCIAAESVTTLARVLRNGQGRADTVMVGLSAETQLRVQQDEDK